MPNIIIPVVKKIFVCDDVIGDPVSGKASVLNVWNAIRVPSHSFPYALGKVCVFAQFRGGVGAISTHVEIVQANTGKLVRRSKAFVLSFVDRTISFRTKIELEDVVFPAAGVYFVEMFCNHQFVDDQPIRVISDPS